MSTSVCVVSIYFLCKLKICSRCSLSCKLSPFFSRCLLQLLCFCLYFVCLFFFFSHYFVFPLLHLHIDKSTPYPQSAGSGSICSFIQCVVVSLFVRYFVCISKDVIGYMLLLLLQFCCIYC